MGKAIIIEGDFSNRNIGKVTFTEDLKLLESLSIGGGNVTNLLIGETIQLTAVFTPLGTVQTSIEWSVNDEQIATVDSNGLVTCVGTGQLRVTLQSLDNLTIHAEKEILCVASRPITGIVITGESTGIVNDTIQLTATLTPSNTTETDILWESDNNTIAEVTQSGLVTLKAVGTVKIIAKSLSNGLVYDELTITVAAEAIPVESITVNGTTPIEVGNTELFSVIYNPTDTTEVGVVWTSSNQNVATVNSNGLVTAIGAGTATITATSIHRQVVAGTQEITITPQVIAITGLTITGGTTVNNGSTLQLGVAYTPSNTTQQGVTWSSSDETKATVNSSGLVTAHAEGSVVITAISTINGAISDTHNITINAVSTNYMWNLDGNCGYVPLDSLDVDNFSCLLELETPPAVKATTYVNFIVASHSTLINSADRSSLAISSYFNKIDLITATTGVSGDSWTQLTGLKSIKLDNSQNKNVFLLNADSAKIGTSINSLVETSWEIGGSQGQGHFPGYIQFGIKGSGDGYGNAYSYATKELLLSAISEGNVQLSDALGAKIKKFILFKSTKYTTAADIISNRASADIDIQFNSDGSPYNAGSSGALVYSSY